MYLENNKFIVEQKSFDLKRLMYYTGNAKL